jgi:hypothetical protein
MEKLTVECPACAADIEPVTMLESLAERETNSATGFIENGQDVDLVCPRCEQDVSIQHAEAFVRLMAHNPILTILDAMQENEQKHGTAGWSEGLRVAVEQEQESFQQKQELREKSKKLREKLGK